MPRTRITAKRKTPQIKNENIVAPGKGLNNFVSENLIDDAESSDLQNVEFIESGAVTKRGGYEQAGDDLSNNPRGLLTFNTSSTNYILTVDGTGLKYLNGSTWTSIAGATYDSSAEIDGTQTRGDLYIFDGVSGGTKLTSALSLSRPGTIPKGKFSVFYSGYHILSGVDGQETRVYVSKDTDASDFTDSGDDATSHPGATVLSGSN